MKTVTLRNDFHNTETTCRPRADGTISPRTYRRVCNDLCGSDDCMCGKIRGNQDGIEIEAWSYNNHTGQVIYKITDHNEEIDPLEITS